MADETFRREQERNCYAPHVRAINELVDRLRDQDGRGGMPHVAPLHGGVEARLLSVLSNPGPGTDSGFLCIENDDPTAERQAESFAAVDIDAKDITPWNAYPWLINRVPTASELEAGLDPLLRVLTLMTHVRVVLLQGNDAKDSWRRLLRRYPEETAMRRLTVVGTYHPSPQALWAADPAVQQQRAQHRRDAYQRAAEVLRETGTP